MKAKFLLLGLSALTVVASPMAAGAQPDRRDVREENREARQAEREARQTERDYQRGDASRRDVREARQDARQERREAARTRYQYQGRTYDSYRGPSWRAPSGYRGQRWARGQRLPQAYRGAVINDYRAYRLAPPPRGYRYERVGNDVYLTAIATGVISAVVANLFY